MRKKKTTLQIIFEVLFYSVFFGLAVFLLWYCFKEISFDSFVEELKSANYYLIAFSAVVGIVALVFRGMRWKMLIKTLGYDVSVYNCYNAVIIGNTINIPLARVGEISRCAVLTRTDRVPFDGLFGTVVVERIIDMLSLGLIVVLVFFLRIDFFGDYMNKEIFFPIWNRISSLFSEVATVIVVGTGVFSTLLIYLFRKYLLNNRFAFKIKEIFLGIIRGVKSIFLLKHYPLFLFYTFCIWFCFWLTGYSVMKAMPATCHLTAIDALFLMVLGSLGWVVPVPGGMGTFHTLVTFGLGLYGISREHGIIFATISHLSQIIPLILFGLFAFIVVFRPKKKKIQKNLS